jgi:hypothetical protein
LSNVLIGIIGVILFIGLALAGALILGEDFRDSQNDSKAAAASQQLAQAAEAVTMNNIKKGTSILPGRLANGDPRTAELVPRFLKNVPVNPTSSSSPAWLLAADGSLTVGNAAYVIFDLGPTALPICDSINRQANGIDTPTTAGAITSTHMTRNVGCMITSTTNGSIGLLPGDHVAYIKI